MKVKNNYPYVWGIFRFLSTPPNSQMFSQESHPGYTFYPFEYTGDIFTIDAMLWQQERVDEQNIYPELSTIAEWMDVNHAGTTLIAFYSLEAVPTICVENCVALNQLPDDLNELLYANYECIGFDIVDVAGLSGLANIGYEQADCISIREHGVKINRWGILSDEIEATQLAEKISALAPEHAPFLVMNIWKKIKK